MVLNRQQQADITGIIETALQHQGTSGGSPPINIGNVIKQLIVPIVFLAFSFGTLYFNFDIINLSVKDHDERLRASEAQAAELRSDQRLINASVEGMHTTQQKMAAEIQAMNEKLDRVGVDMALIKERVGVRR